MVGLVPGLVVARTQEPGAPLSSERYMPPSLPRKTRRASGLAVDRRRIPVHRLLIGVHADARSALPTAATSAVVERAQLDVRVEDVVLVLRVDPDLAEPPLEAAVGARTARPRWSRRRKVAAVVGVVEALVRAGRVAEDDVDAMFGLLGAIAMPMRPRLGCAVRPVCVWS